MAMNMGNLNKLATTAQEAMQEAMGIAAEAESAETQPIHLLKALLVKEENNITSIQKRIGAEPAHQHAQQPGGQLPQQGASVR